MGNEKFVNEVNVFIVKFFSQLKIYCLVIQMTHNQSSLLTRTIRAEIENDVTPRAVLLFGPRRIGKTTLIRQIVGNSGCRWINGDMDGAEQALTFRNAGDVRNALTQAPFLVIDEAHKLSDIGTIVKILVDENERLETPCRIFLTSSSAFYLATVKESALGRVVSRQMWPFSLHELAQKLTWGTVNSFMDTFLVNGMMPMVCLYPESAAEYLEDYCAGYLLRDFYETQQIKHTGVVRRLLEKLARNLGSEISYDRLGQELSLSRNTVEDYIERLQACSLIRVCPSYSRNLDNEMKKGKKIYFFDNGVRNALIGDFSPMAQRSDAGALWENFFFMERQKLHDTFRDGTKTYFWRTTGASPKEIDFLEVRDGNIEAFECKYSAKVRTTRHADFFRKTYPNSRLSVVHPDDCMRVFRDAYENPVRRNEATDLGVLLRA